MNVTRTLAGTGTASIGQEWDRVEHLVGRTVILSFDATVTNGVNLLLNAYWVQDFGGGGSTQVRTPVGTALLTSQENRFDFMFKVPHLTGSETVGTEPTASLVFEFAATVDFAFALSRVDLFEGVTPRQWTPTPTAEEEARADRLYKVWTASHAASTFLTGRAQSATEFRAAVQHGLMARIPVIQLSDVSVTCPPGGGGTLFTATRQGLATAEILVSGCAGMTAGLSGELRAISSTARITFNARRT